MCPIGIFDPVRLFFDRAKYELQSHDFMSSTLGFVNKPSL